MRPNRQLCLSSVTDCDLLYYTADVPPHARGVAFCCSWLLGGSKICLQRCILRDTSLSHALRSLSAAVTALLANHINFASQNASQNSELIGAGSTYKSKSLRVKAGESENCTPTNKGGERKNFTPTNLLARCQGFHLYRLE